ncbi:MAG: hypothetical protein WKF87_16000 [Chryseolinea sp.]
MPIFEFIAEVVVRIVVDVVLHAPFALYNWVIGKSDKLINGYRTERKQYIKFDAAKKFIMTWETDIELLKHKVRDVLELMNKKSDVSDFQFTILGERTVIKPPTSLSFYSFHFLVQSLTEEKIQTIGIVETGRTAYTTYNDPDSENLIGKTDKGKRFFITLMEDYSKTQFLRINRRIRTIKDYDIHTIKSELAQSNSSHG